MKLLKYFNKFTSVSNKLTYININSVADALAVYKNKKPALLFIRELGAFILYALLVFKIFNKKDMKLKKSTIMGIYVRFYHVRIDSGNITRFSNEHDDNPFSYHIEMPFRNMLKKNEQVHIEHLDNFLRANNPYFTSLSSKIELVDWKLTINGQNMDGSIFNNYVNEHFKITGKTLKPKYTPFKIINGRPWFKSTLKDNLGKLP